MQKVTSCKGSIFNILVLMLLIVNSGLLGYVVFNVMHKSNQEILSADQLRSHAAKLRSNGLVDESAETYEQYMKQVDVTKEKKANIYLLISEAYLEEHDYKKALSMLYKAELFDENKTYRSEIGSNIVLCLEKLGRSLDASAALNERAVLGDEQDFSEEKIIAQVGSRFITMAEIDRAINELPTDFQAQYKDEIKKGEFIQQYLANKVLMQKGISLKLNEDKDLNKRVTDFKEALIVERVLQDEIGADISFDPQDVINYYEANKEKYIDPETKLPIPLEEIQEQVQQDYYGQKLPKKAEAYVRKLFKDYNVKLFYEPSVSVVNNQNQNK